MSSLEADRVATMAIDDLPSLYDGLIKLARSGMGVTAFGVQVLDLPAVFTTQSHVEADSGAAVEMAADLQLRRDQLDVCDVGEAHG